MKDKNLHAKIDYFAKEKAKHRFQTTWFIHEVEDVNQVISDKKSASMKYRFIGEDNKWKEVTAKIKGNTVLDFWKAAEECYTKANAQGDWHSYIEAFTTGAYGFVVLHMGS